MKKENKKQALREMKALSLSLYELYLAQASEKINSYHENGHDNSGGHPDYHCNQHDNTPSRMMRLVLTKDVTN